MMTPYRLTKAAYLLSSLGITIISITWSLLILPNALSQGMQFENVNICHCIVCVGGIAVGCWTCDQ